MSIYEITKKIEKDINVIYHKEYEEKHVVAKCRSGDEIKVIYLRNYSKELLEKEIKENEEYDEIIVDIEFWDKSFCEEKNLDENDLKNSIYESIGGLYLFIECLCKIHRSYTKNEKIDMEVDKNIMRVLLSNVDIVFPFFNDILVDLITSVFSDDNILMYMTTPSGKLRFGLLDVKNILAETRHVDEISTLFMVSEDYNNDILLQYHYNLFSVCHTINSPEFIDKQFLKNYNNVFFNLLNLETEKDTYYMKVIDKYIDAGGSIDIEFAKDVTDTGWISLYDMIQANLR
jgi:hypothetical protein